MKRAAVASAAAITIGGLLAAAGPGPAARAAGVPTLAIDVAADRHPISPDIYGMNRVVPAWVADLHLPVDRWGGDDTSRYNWHVGGTNDGDDWYFENHSVGADVRFTTSSTVEQFVDKDRKLAAKSLVTIPIIGWIAKDNPDNTATTVSCGFRVSKYAAQYAAGDPTSPDPQRRLDDLQPVVGSHQPTDPYRNDCGDGVAANGSNVTGNDWRDTSIPETPAYAASFVKHLVDRYGRSADGGVPIYQYDNEPSLWNSTHRDVHPSPLTFDELVTRTEQFGAAMHAADPSAALLGPGDWGPEAWFDSPAGDESKTHGGLPLVPYYLASLAAYDRQHGVRLLDYLDEHYYPASPNGAADIATNDPGDAATQARRLRAVRSLWDPSYHDESYLTADLDYPPLMMIPRMRGWAAKYYPGTKTAITEYNLGGFAGINGALAEADALGVFGREGLDLATWFDLSPPGDRPTNQQPGWFAFRMFRDYDGHGGAYGDTWVRSTSSDQGQLAVYGSIRSADGALTAVVVNKTGGDLTTGLQVTGLGRAAGVAHVYVYSPAHLSGIVAQPDQPFSGTLTHAFPADSITMVVVPAAG